MGNGFSTDFGFSHCYSNLFEWPYSFSFFLFLFLKLLTILTCTNEVTWSISCQIDWNFMVHCSHLSFILQKLRLSAKEVIFESIVSLGTLVEKICFFHLNSGASDVC